MTISSKCPYCGKFSVPFWRKIHLVPLTVTYCELCGKAINVPGWAYLLANLPMLIALYLILVLNLGEYEVILIVAGIAISIYSHRFTPLHKVSIDTIH